MPNIKLLKDPGFIYDLSFIFCLKFNLKSCLKRLDGKVDGAATAAYFSGLQEHFGDISDDLYVFFCEIDDGRTFFPEFYFSPYREQFADGYDFDFMLKELSDHDRLIKNLLRFYLYSLSDEELELCLGSTERLMLEIKRSDYSPETKLKLYEFFIDPTPHIQSLEASLAEKKELLDRYYEENGQKITELHSEASFDKIRDQVRLLYDLDYIEKGEQELYVSYCLLNKYCVAFIPSNDSTTYLLGTEYKLALEFLKNDPSTPNIQKFGQAIGDENRMKILHLLLEREEITRKDLERTFSFSGTTAYHHITLMTNAGVIKTRNEGKTIVYSLNREYFDNIIDALKRYSTKEV